MMADIIVVLIGVFVVLAYPLGFEPDVYSPAVTAAAVPGMTLLYAGFGVIVARRFAMAFSAAISPAGSPERPDVERLCTLYARWTVAYKAMLVLCAAAQIYVFHWPIMVYRTLGLGNTVFIHELLVLLPFFVTLFLGWASLYGCEKILRGGRAGFIGYFLFKLRFSVLLVAAPMLSLILMIEIVLHIPGSAVLVMIYPVTMWAALVFFVCGLFLLAPLFIRLVSGAKPLPAGPLRDRLQALSARSGVGFADVLVVGTRGWTISNAMVSGLVRPLRYIFLTDALVEALSPEEIEAVAAHEIGHCRHHHMAIFLLMTVGYLALALSTEELTASLGAAAPILAAVQSALSMAFFWFWMFGYLSRRFEKQADLYGASLVGAPEHLGSALEKVAAVNGGAKTVSTWRHFGVHQRVAYLIQARLDPSSTVVFARKMKAITAGILVAFLLCMVLAIVAAGRQFAGVDARKQTMDRERRATELVIEAVREYDAKNLGQAEMFLRRAIVLWPERTDWRMGLGDILVERSKFGEAHEVYQSALLDGPRDPYLRIELRKRLR
jgi:STE24 endopeptidase